MEKFSRHFAHPLRSITDQPFQFAVWWFVAIVIGSAGFLVPILVAWTLDRSMLDASLAAIKAGALASFSIVLLSEGLAAAIVAQGAGASLAAAGLRGLVSVFAFAVALVQVVFLAVESAMTDFRVPSPALQVVVTALAIVFASYLYCFRFASWERGPEAVQEADNRAVQDLAHSAERTTVDDKGVKL